MAKRYYARADRGLAGTRQWIGSWYEHMDHLRIEKIEIEPYDIPASALRPVRQQNQSELHTYLKCVAWRWLLDASQHPDTINPEVKCYSPVEEWCLGRKIYDENGREIDIATPKVLPVGSDPFFPLSYGLVIRMDLHCSDKSVEIGGTEPFNLLLPLLDGHVEEAVWLPYPQGVEPKTFRLGQTQFDALNAYAISWRD